MGYTGQTQSVNLGQYGLMTDLPPDLIPHGALIDASNITMTNGRLQKMPGVHGYLDPAATMPWNDATNTYYDAHNAADFVGIFDWHPTAERQRMIAAMSNGYLWRDDGAGTFAQNSSTPLNKIQLIKFDPNCTFVTGGVEAAGKSRKLFFFSNGRNQVQVLTGDASIISPMTQPAADWKAGNFPTCGALHKSHLWVFAGQMAYGSSTTDHEDFVTPASLILQQVFPGEGGEIIGAYVYKGRLFCFKRDGYSYWLDDANSDSQFWSWQRLSAHLGLSAPNAVTEAGDDMLIGNNTGTVTSFKATQSLGSISSGDLYQSVNIKGYLRGNMSNAGLANQHAIYYAEKSQVFFTTRSSYQTTNDTLICVDTAMQGNPRITPLKLTDSGLGSPQCLGLRRDINNILRPMYAGSGFIGLMDRETRLIGTCVPSGTSGTYNARFQTSHLTLGSAEQKLFDFIRVSYIPETPTNMNIAYYIDGKYIDTITVAMLQYTRPESGVLTLDTDRLAQDNPESTVAKLTGMGRRISFKFYQNNDTGNFQITSFDVMFRLAGNSAQKTE